MADLGQLPSRAALLSEKDSSVSKKITFTENSLSKNITYKQFSTVTKVVHGREIDPNHVLRSAVWNPVTKQVEYTGPTATVGQILTTSRVIDSETGKERNNYDVLPHLNVVDAATLLDYLFNAPNKGSNNGTVQPTTGQPNPKITGFGGIAQ